MAESLYISEHRRCVNYESDKSPVIEFLGTDVDTVEIRDTASALIVYIMTGGADLSWGTTGNYLLKAGDLMLFPPGVRITARIEGLSKAMVMRLNGSVKLCDSFKLENLYHEYYTDALKHTHLESNTIIKRHMKLMNENIANGLRCTYFLDRQVQDILYYLRAYYTKEELAGFSLPLLGANAQFMDFIWKNYRQVHDVKQFAKLANCSLSAFKVKFKKIVGIPPSEWLLEQKVRNIYHDIFQGHKSLSEISEEYHFSSASNFGTFCRKHLGVSPNHLRQSR